MAKARSNLNVNVDPDVAARFREVAAKYKDKLGLCLAASMMMFLEADPRVQGEYLSRLLNAQVRDEVEELLAEIRAEQAARVKARDIKEKRA